MAHGKNSFPRGERGVMKLNAYLDPYEAFMKFGYGDGDDPGAEWAIRSVRGALGEVGLSIETAGGLHNSYIYDVFSSVAGELRVEIPIEVAYLSTGDEVREELMKLLPARAIEVLDNLR